MSKKCINSPNAPQAVGPYSHAVEANGFYFVSGQCAFQRDRAGLIEGTFEDEVRKALENLMIVLAHKGLTADHVVKTTVFLDDMNNFAEFNAIYAEYFAQGAPARSCVEVSALPKGARVEVEAIATLSL